MDLIGTCLNDDSIGPVVRGCRENFDFTVKFEKIFFSILPSSIFIASFLTRIAVLTTRPTILRDSTFRYIKLAVILVYSSVRLSSLVLSCLPINSSAQLAANTNVSISSSALEFALALSLAPLSILEHSRSPRPSILLSGYLLLSLLFDVAQCRTLWLSAAANGQVVVLARLSTASVAAKAGMIILESRQKKKRKGWFEREEPEAELKNDEETSPEETIGIYGLATFIWLDSLFWTGYKKVLTLEDLFPLDRKMAADHLQVSFAERLRKEKAATGGVMGPRSHRLAVVLAKTLAVPLFLPVAPRIALLGLTFSQPFLIEALLDHLERPDDGVSKNAGYGLIAATVLIYSGIAVATALYWYLHERCLYMARGCLAGAVYRRTTRPTGRAGGAGRGGGGGGATIAGDDSAALTLMSTDVERIRLGFLNLHEFWANTIEVALASWLLERKLGAAFAAPIVIVVLCVAASAVLGRYAGPRQKAWMEKIQKRVGLTASAVASMKHLKMSGLTAPVEEAIQGMREDELRVGNKFRLVQILAAVVAFTPLSLAPVATFAVTSRQLDVATIFTSLAYLLLLSSPLGTIFQAIPSLLAAFACLNRIQAFLGQDPPQDFREKGVSGDDESSDAAVRVHDGSFGWGRSTEVVSADNTHMANNPTAPFSVRNVNLTIAPARLTLVVGPVASGKSTLCKALLGETPLATGRVVLGSHHHRIGYCDQTPFLSNATIRENIVGFSSWDPDRYAEVVEATLLARDLLLFPNGDGTRIGSDGITISGGQKQRVAIARALYLRSDLVILDDVLSGLDADTEEQVFCRILGPNGLLRRRKSTIIFCTHSVRHLPSADHIIALGADGNLVEEGSFSQLMANKKYIFSLGVDATTIATASSAAATDNVSVRTLIPASDGRSNTGSRLEVLEEQTIGDAPTSRTEAQSALEASSPATNPYNAPDGNAATGHDHTRRLGDVTVYKHYFGNIGFWPVAIFLSLGAASGFLLNWQTIWVKFWSDDLASPQPSRPNAYYVGLLALFQVSGLASLFCLVCVVFLVMTPASGSALHRAALRTVVGAPLRFLATTDTGVVTNLFSQDMTLIDGELPVSLANVALQGFIALGMSAVIATASPHLLAVYPFLLAVLYGVQKFYLATSRQLRLLDLEAKSPLYAQFIDTAKGGASIRAFGWVDAAVRLNDELLDRSQRPAYLLAMIQRWLGFTLAVLVAVVAVAIVSIATQMRRPGSSGFTGASLVTIMSFGEVLSEIIRTYTLLETSIGAVGRLKSFSETTKPEDQPGEDVVPPESWPSGGQIEIKGVSASYGDLVDESSGDSLALKDLNVTIHSGEKVAICGRTGSGKSSTIHLLLRLLDPLPPLSSSSSSSSSSGDGSITIDDIPLHQIDRTALRQRIIAVPQDPVFLSDGTSFRKNLDPFGRSTDPECRAVLEDVDLWALVDQRGGLDAEMAAHCSFSQGQRQLFSLARAVLRRRIRSRVILGEAGAEAEGGILLLDEVSSSVDRDTECAMQDIILREFEGYTIVMVSHRLEVVMSHFDRVILMDSGTVVETGPPRRLLEIDGGRFRDLWLVGR